MLEGGAVGVGSCGSGTPHLPNYCQIVEASVDERRSDGGSEGSSESDDGVDGSGGDRATCQWCLVDAHQVVGVEGGGVSDSGAAEMVVAAAEVLRGGNGCSGGCGSALSWF